MDPEYSNSALSDSFVIPKPLIRAGSANNNDDDDDDDEEDDDDDDDAAAAADDDKLYLLRVAHNTKH